MLALLGLTEAVTLKADVNLLGASGEQSERLHDHMRRFWNYKSAPTYLLASDPIKRETRLAWGNRIEALMASQKSVRGPHPQRLRIDEVDEMDLVILDAAFGQPMSKPGIPAQTVLSSTHQNADGTMTEILRRAAKNSWPVYEWCWRETSAGDGWLSPEEVEEKRRLVTATMWQIEYDLQEPAPLSRAIDPARCAAMFDASLGHYDGRPGEYVEAEPPVFVCACGDSQAPGECSNCKQQRKPARYSTGADWARKQDWTVIVTMRNDVMPRRIVAYQRMQRQPWPLMIAAFDRQVARYNSRAGHDVTGIGDVIAAYLDRPAEGYQLVGRLRQDIISSYVTAIENGEIISPVIETMLNEHRYASVDDLYGAGHLPDTICAAAIANYLAARPRGRFVA